MRIIQEEKFFLACKTKLRLNASPNPSYSFFLPSLLPLLSLSLSKHVDKVNDDSAHHRRSLPPPAGSVPRDSPDFFVAELPKILQFIA